MSPDMARSAVQRGTLCRDRPYGFSIVWTIPDAGDAHDVRRNDRDRRVVGLRGLDRIEEAGRAAARVSRPNAHNDAEVEPLPESGEEALGDFVPTWLQGRDRPRSAVRVHRTFPFVEGILSTKGDWLGAAAIRVDRSA